MEQELEPQKIEKVECDPVQRTSDSIRADTVTSKSSPQWAFYTENSWHKLTVSNSHEQEYCATKRDVPQWQACPEWEEVSSELAYEMNLTVHLDSTFVGTCE